MAEGPGTDERVEREALSEIVLEGECTSLNFFIDDGRQVCGVHILLTDRPAKGREEDLPEYLWVILDTQREADLIQLRGKYTITVKPSK